MASRLSHSLVAAALAGSLIVSSTEAVAATVQPAPPLITARTAHEFGCGAG